jgi:hypothetical protein
MLLYYSFSPLLLVVVDLLPPPPLIRYGMRKQGCYVLHITVVWEILCTVLILIELIVATF